MEVSIKEYVDRIFEERSISLNLTAKYLERQLDHLNGLRRDVVEDRGEFLPRSEYSIHHKTVVDKIEDIKSFQSKMIGIGITLIFFSAIAGAVITHILFK